MRTVESSINLLQPVHTTTARRAHNSPTVQNRPTIRVERHSISRRRSSIRSRLTSQGSYSSLARNQSPVSYHSRHVDHRKGLDIALVELAISIHQTGIDEAIYLNLYEGHVNKAQIPNTDTHIHLDTGTIMVIPQAVVYRGVTITDVVIIVVLQALVHRGVITLEVVVIKELADKEIAEEVLVQVHIGV